MLDALNKSQLLVLDLDCEAKENWRLRSQFGQTPWLWCTIQNFGGNVGLSSPFDILRERPAQALAEAGPGHGQMRGIGALMEGSETEPLVWELFFHNAWSTSVPDGDLWLRDYGRRRYGADSPSALRALHLLRETVYNPLADGAPLNSVVCARPSLEPFPKARRWGTTESHYDPPNWWKPGRTCSTQRRPAAPATVTVMIWPMSAVRCLPTWPGVITRRFAGLCAQRRGSGAPAQRPDARPAE